ncbi:hypothetical protein I4U23_005638 [Adineta vaga]|nr:hypothetical protein I4U23_005638 [Adineta vaga]
MFISISSKIYSKSWILMVMCLHHTTGLWYNRPQFSSCASWNSNGITFANESTFGRFPHGLFVDINNTVYAGSWFNSIVKVWYNGSSTSVRTITNGIHYPYGLFASKDGDIYIDNGARNSQVDKWTSNATYGVRVMNISNPCWGLFIDTNNSLYCSLDRLHMVIKVDLNKNSMIPITVAGNGSAGSTSLLLNDPNGIFVDTEFTLYVAECGNNRIQRFSLGDPNGTTVVGNTIPGTISLKCPTSIIIDGNGFLFIMDSRNHRIVAQNSLGFRCIAGCSGTSGSASNQFNHAQYIAFDNYGNLFVTDKNNHRIQKFILTSNTCTTITTSVMTTSAMITSPITTSTVTDSASTKMDIKDNISLPENFDCIYIRDNVNSKYGESSAGIIPYCRRPDTTENVMINLRKCENDGEIKYFIDLLKDNIQPFTVLEWSTSIVMTEQYAAFYYKNDSKTELNGEKTFLCHCVHSSTFGRYCEYQLTHGANSFEASQNLQAMNRFQFENHQLFGNICIDGWDEENCDKLEFNECEDDEYRCNNGMCIPEEYWLDGDRDCMDWSDEIFPDDSDSWCFRTTSTIDCDEHICGYLYWSSCDNLRNLNYMCELSLKFRAWTLPNGLCWLSQDRYDDPQLNMNNTMLKNKEKYIYLIRCIFSDGLGVDCPCNAVQIVRVSYRLIVQIIAYHFENIVIHHGIYPKHIDESSQYCQSWICHQDQYQCQTGECIPLEWLCDKQWDCSDASDEEALLFINIWSFHNKNLKGLNESQTKCLQYYSNLSFSNFCVEKNEFPCLRSNVSDPLNFTKNPPCISYKKIGDDIDDCYNAYDEKNTFENTNGNILIDHYEFHLNPFSNQLLLHKKSRFFNRTDIEINHPYSIHFNIYILSNIYQLPKLLGSWRYPIYFDFLPSFRFVKILRFPT